MGPINPTKGGVPNDGVGRAFVFFLLVPWLALVTELFASAPGVDDVRFRHIGVGEGLSQPTARAIVQDEQGFVWIGTQDGLNRFDGREFRVFRYDPFAPGSLSDNHIVGLAVDQPGGLWIATQSGGLNYLAPVSDRFISFRHDPNDPASLVSDALLEVLTDDAGRVWVQAEDGRIQWLDPATGRFESASAETHGIGRDLRLLGLLGNDVLLTRQGRLYRWTDTMAEPELLVDLGRAVERIRVVQVDSDALWVGTDNHGLFQLDRAGRLQHHWLQSPDASGLISNQIRSLTSDRTGQVWVGTPSGMTRLDPASGHMRSWSHDPNDPLGLPGSRVIALLEDREGMIWAGTWTGGLAVFDPLTSAFTLIRNRPEQALSLPGNAVADVLENPDGTLWVSLLDVGGMAIFDPEHGLLERFHADPDAPGALPHRMVGTLLHDGDGLLVGTLGGGLVRLDPATGRFERLFEDPQRDVSRTALVENLQRDRAGTLWASTIGDGLYHACADCDRFEQYVPDVDDPHSIAGDEINGVLEAADGTFWVALRRYGLSRLDRSSGRFETIAAGSNGLRSSSITGLHEDRRGTLWVGTQGGGLHRLDHLDPAPRFTAIGRSEGLDADAIGEIAEDRQGRIWVSTSAGLSRINPESLSVENFPFIDGHSGAGFFIGSIDQSGPGHAWFGGIRGLVRVDMDLIPEQFSEPRVILTNLLLFNQVVSPGSDAVLPQPLATMDALTLAHDHNLVTLEFTAPGIMRQARELRYAYRLDGLDRDWIETRPERAFATYTVLPPGHYRLQVRAGTQPDRWGPVTELPLTVMAPPWSRPEAIMLYVLLLLLLTALIAWRVHLGLSRRRRAQEQIAASRERLRMALWGSRDELWEADMHKGTLVRENRIDRISEDDDVARMSLEEFWSSVHPADVDGLKNAFLEHARGRTEHLEAEFRVRSRHGSWHWMLSRGRVRLRDSAGKAWLMSGTTRDITALKRTEEALRRLNDELEARVQDRTAELEASNQTLTKALKELQITQRHLVQTEKMAALGGLVAGIAHEINTPLGVGVTAASHLEGESRRFHQLLEQVPPPDLRVVAGFAAKAEQSSQLILRNLRRADQLVRSFKQVAVDQASEQRRTFEVGAYLEEILLSLHPELKRSPHKVEHTVSEPLVLESYPGALYQIMVNLIMNSLTHAWDDQQAGQVRIDVRGADDWITLRYSDDGKGMADEVADKMFDPFFTTRRGQGGSGLGLHIVYNLVTRVMGGRIETRTAPGEGVNFDIHLPRVAPDTAD